MNDRALIIAGMKRSGHHAIITWLYSNLTGTSFAYNDSIFHKGEIVKSTLNKPDPEVYGDGSEPFNYIYNFEDFDVRKTHDWKKYPQIHRASRVDTILVLRSPFNWVASSVKCGGYPTNHIKRRVAIWKLQAAEFSKGPDSNYDICLSFDEWFRNVEYRKALAARLKLPTHNKGINIVNPHGNGSSFDGMRKKKTGQDMDVLNRAGAMVDNDLYQSFAQDPVLLKYQKLIFS